MRYRRRPSLDYEYVQIDQRVHLLERVVQAIGFTPDFPYTLNVNDGTLNRVLIGKINGDYGIKILDNTGAEVILANGTIVADAIKTGTLDADRIAVGSLPGLVIEDGTLAAEKLIAGTITATSACIASLNAGWITVGTMGGEHIQEGTLHANRIQANTITAGQISSNTIITQSIQIGNNIIGTGHITSITGSKIETGTLDANRIVAGSITSDRIAARTIQAGDIAYYTIDSGELADNAADTRVIGTGQVVAGHIASYQIETHHLKSDIIETGHLKARQITTLKIDLGAVNYGEIANDAVRDYHVHSLSANKLSAGTIDCNIINVVNINASNITAGTITANYISGGTLAGTFTVTSGAYIHFDYGGDLRSRIGNTIEVANTLIFMLDTGVGGWFRDYLEVDGQTELMGVVGIHGNLYMNSSDIYQCDHIQTNSITTYHLDSASSYIDVWDEIRCHSGSSGCGFIELGLMKDKEAKSIDRFSEGDVLIWKKGQLEKCAENMCRRIVAVAGKDGRPILYGAENIKVMGKVEEGDFLVGSGVAGYARAEAFPVLGSVIAQALENCSGEKGLIKAMIWRM